VSDISFDEKHKRLFVSGYDTRSIQGKQVEVAFIHNYDIQGNLIYKIFDFDENQFDKFLDHTRITRIVPGNDGYIYAL